MLGIHPFGTIAKLFSWKADKRMFCIVYFPEEYASLHFIQSIVNGIFPHFSFVQCK